MDALKDAQNAYLKLQETVRLVPVSDEVLSEDLEKQLTALQTACWDALSDDLNVSEALSHIFDMAKLIRKMGKGSHYLVALCDDLGLNLQPESNTVSAEILTLLDERQAAKANRDFGEADRIRDLILDAGYQIKDTASGPELIATHNV